ncbi:MAG TPA: ABC transporter permease [Ktedonobacteraceae bacterium]|nr:ABC transporter permease [Ktedonobacteraceae bacterium]
MAVPLAATTASNVMARIRKILQSFAGPIFAVVLAMVAGSIVIMVTTPGSLPDRLSGAVAAYQALLYGAFGSGQNLSFTLTTVTPLILASISVALTFRAKLFNIGAGGQLAMGGMTAGVIGFELPHAPGWVLIPLMIIGGIIAGAIWGGIAGFLKAWRGAHEVVTTIMLNWIAFFFTNYLINGPFQSLHTANQTDPIPTQATLPHISNFYNYTLGTFLPKIANPSLYFVDVGFFFSLLALVIYWFIISRTTFGYEVRVIGENPKAAHYAGIPIKRNIFLVMAIGGAFSGLAGALQLMGQFPYQLIANTFATQSTGFDAIGVALLGRTTSIGVFLASLLFGGLRQGGTYMQISAGVPGDIVYIMQALVLFSIAAEFLASIQRSLRRRSISRRAALSPSGLATAVAPLPDTLDERDLNNRGKDNGNVPEQIAPVRDKSGDTINRPPTEE